MCVQFVILINIINSIILSYTTFHYYMIPIMKFTKLIIMDLVYLQKYESILYIAHLHSIFIAKNKRIGFEKVILDIDS